MAQRGLGKGLDSLIPASGNSENKEVKQAETMVKIAKVEPNRDQPRKNFDEDALQELADSIKQFGLLQPILVQDRKEYYEIIAGERRWRAAKLAGLREVPVIVRNYTDQEIVEISLIENIQREDLNPIEEALAYRRLLEEFHLKQDEVAERVSKSRTAVTNSMRLLKLCDNVQQMIIDDPDTKKDHRDQDRIKKNLPGQGHHPPRSPRRLHQKIPTEQHVTVNCNDTESLDQMRGIVYHSTVRRVGRKQFPLIQIVEDDDHQHRHNPQQFKICLPF